MSTTFPSFASLTRAFSRKGLRIRRVGTDWIHVLTDDHETSGTCWSVEFLPGAADRPCPTKPDAHQCLAVRFHPEGTASPAAQTLAADLADIDRPDPTDLDAWEWLPYVPLDEPLTARIVVWAVEESALMRADARVGAEPEWDQISSGRRIARLWRDGRDSHDPEDLFAGLRACAAAPSREYEYEYDPLRPEDEDPYTLTEDDDREHYRELLSGWYAGTRGTPADWSVDDEPVDVATRMELAARWHRQKGREEGLEQGLTEGYRLGWEACATEMFEEDTEEDGEED